MVGGMVVGLKIINTSLVNNMVTTEKIMEYAKAFVENVTGTEITSMQFRQKDCPENIEKLKEAVCKAYDIKPSDLVRKGRYKELVRPRQMFYYVAIERFGMRLIEAGKIFGHDHTTAVHSRDKVRDLLSINDEETIEKLELVNEYLK